MPSSIWIRRRRLSRSTAQRDGTPVSLRRPIPPDCRRGGPMSGQGKLITGVVVGAGAMYLLDPDRRAPRRPLLREEGVHAGGRVQTEIAAKARHVGNPI